MPRKFFKYLILILLVVFIANVVSYYENINTPANKNGAEVSFVIAPGESVKKIAQNLQTQGLIKSKYQLEFYIWQIKGGALMQAGVYKLSSRMTVKEIVASFIAGKTVSQEKEITVIPGWTLRDIAKYLAAQGIASTTDFYKLAGEPMKNYTKLKDTPADYSADFSVLADKPKNYGLEGYLFPDTYRVYNNATAGDVIKKMLANLDDKLTPAMRGDIKMQKKTIYQIITMASIIEKEVSKEADMKIVSGIFWGRMKIGMPLQSDATLTYALGENKTAHTLAETKLNLPYNTYFYQGLPPGPICNPSLAAIEAAIYPTPTDYRYFLSRPDTGETIFSKTLDEHNLNKAKYLK